MLAQPHTPFQQRLLSRGVVADVLRQIHLQAGAVFLEPLQRGLVIGIGRILILQRFEFLGVVR